MRRLRFSSGRHTEDRHMMDVPTPGIYAAYDGLAMPPEVCHAVGSVQAAARGQTAARSFPASVSLPSVVARCRHSQYHAVDCSSYSLFELRASHAVAHSV